MDFGFSEEQELLRGQARDFLDKQCSPAVVRSLMASETGHDPALWSRIRRTISAFLVNEWRKGALFGLSPDQAFFVKCDDETNPSESIDAGMVVCQIGVAPVKPAEFVIFQLSQFSGGASLTE